MNCHPKKSAHIVREVIDKLRSGEQNKAEFWINKPGLFIYIYYVAVRDSEGKFRGVLEMMQDCTRIRGFEGSRTLLTWATEDNGGTVTMEEEQKEEEEKKSEAMEEKYEEVVEITPDTKLKPLLKQYPHLAQRLPEIAPEFKMLNTPLGKLIIGKVDIKMMSERSGIAIDTIIEGLKKIIQG